ncbi:MAG: DUF6265 family protein [Planctomycetota bacterium]|jgi:hypothetical protein
MMKLVHRLAVVLAVMAGTAIVYAHDTKKAVESEPTATEILSWLQGTWRPESPGEVWEETWSAPEGDGLVGMTRWVKDGKVVLYELLSVVDGKDGQHLRTRHFNRGLVPWPS